MHAGSRIIKLLSKGATWSRGVVGQFYIKKAVQCSRAELIVIDSDIMSAAAGSPADRQKMRELLEERKRKLEELKQKNANQSSPLTNNAISTPDKSVPSPAASLLSPLPAGLLSPSMPATPSQGVVGSVRGTPVSNVLSMVNSLVSSPAVAPASSTTQHTPASSMAFGGKSLSRIYRPSLNTQLAASSFDLPSKEIPMHSRGAQTDGSLFAAALKEASSSTANISTDPVNNSSISQEAPELDSETDDDILTMSNDADPSAGIATPQCDQLSELVAKHCALPSNQKQQILSSHGFLSVFKRMTPLLEHAMTIQDLYFLGHPAMQDSSLEKLSAAPSPMKQRGVVHGEASPVFRQHTAASSHLSLALSLQDEQWTRDQEIYDVQWCSSDPTKLLSVCYSSAAGSGILEWNLEFEGKIESRHHTPARITAARYWSASDNLRMVPADLVQTAPSKQNLILGGSYTGQILLWDQKAPSYRPIVTLSHSATLDIAGGTSPHQHPIYNIIPIDSHLFATADTMGLLAIWDMNKLQQPVEVLSLSWTAGASDLASLGSGGAPSSTVTQQEIAVTSLCFRDDNTFYAASEDGGLFQGQRHGDHRGLVRSLGRTHDATVTSVDLHPSPSPSLLTGRTVSVRHNLSDLLLTSSADWSICLWNPRTTTSPLYRFMDFADYVLDAKWSPAHPAIFAAADGSGAVSVWNLNQDFEVPQAINQSSKVAVNKLVWSPHVHTHMSSTPTDFLLAGATHHSTIHLYKLDREFGMPIPEDWAKFDDALSNLDSNTVSANRADSS